MKITTEDFIKEARKLHQGKGYDYSKVIYLKANKKVEIICPVHGSFFQTPNSHNSSRSPQNCYFCSPNKKSNTKEFIEKSKKIHGDKYDYSESIYVNSKIKIKIYCKEHSQFFYQNANNNLQGQGCPCGRLEKISKGNSKYNKDIFIKKAKEIHGDKYDYSLSDFKNIKSILKILCRKHNKFFNQVADNHLRSIHCCPFCIIEKNKRTQRMTREEFIHEAKRIHGELYDYSLSNYIHGDRKIKIICKRHGVFNQLPRSHIWAKCGCPYCKSSRGENLIEKILIENKIKYERQKYFKNCKLKRMLPFDFYLKKHNVLIEYHGEQHYKKVRHFYKKNDTFLLRKKRDGIKISFAETNKIKLIIIPYYFKSKKDIEDIILKGINEN